VSQRWGTQVLKVSVGLILTQIHTLYKHTYYTTHKHTHYTLHTSHYTTLHYTIHKLTNNFLSNIGEIKVNIIINISSTTSTQNNNTSKNMVNQNVSTNLALLSNTMFDFVFQPFCWFRCLQDKTYAHNL